MINRTLVVLLVITASQTACQSREPVTRMPRIQQEASVDAPPHSVGQALERFTASQADLMVALGAYYAEHGEWPDSARELTCFSHEKALLVDLSMFSEVRLAKKEGSVAIRYQLAPPWQGSGTVRLSATCAGGSDGYSASESAGRAAHLQHVP